MRLEEVEEVMGLEEVGAVDVVILKVLAWRFCEVRRGWGGY